MILANQLTLIGKFNSPHGIHGEISANFDVDVDIPSLRCIVLDMDGIFVPFFIINLRQKNTNSFLLTIDGVSNEKEASQIANKPIYAVSDELPNLNHDLNDGEGLYADDMIGFTIADTDMAFRGNIVDINDATENVLFIVETDDRGIIYIPVADEYIEEIDINQRHVTVDLPAGFLDIYNN